MVHAELTHNPYLLHTSVLFNGNPPRINSQVEKYEMQTLKDWVHQVPAIFYDEMNGLDFDLSFTGTAPDFEEVKRAFEKAGISQEDVRLFHKNELEDADTKSDEVDALLAWLNENPNRKFDHSAFQSEYSEFFSSSYPFIVLGASVDIPSDPQISVEAVTSADELQGTVLTNTPVLFCINIDTMDLFRSNLMQILKRKDVSNNQLFFMIHPNLDTMQIRRIIIDLGIDEPQIVASIEAGSIKSYLRNYPITEYIRSAIKIFEEIVARISSVLETENLESEVLNAEIHARIDQYEGNIASLKSAIDFFANRDNVQTPQVFYDLQESLDLQIKKWRNRKTKVIGEQESAIAAREYEADLRKYVQLFSEGIRKEYQQFCVAIHQLFKEKYMAQGLDKDYLPENAGWSVPEECVFAPLVDDLLGLQEVTFEEPKTDLFNMFIKPAVPDTREPVRVVTCYYEHWRNKASDIILEQTGEYIHSLTESLRTYYDSLAKAFMEHLEELVRSQVEQKENTAAQLSDDERKLQEDNDWLSCFKEQLFVIERG